MTRREHWQVTGHATYETSLALCVRLGVRKGLHGWQPEACDRVAVAWQCTTCLLICDETPDEDDEDGTP